MGSSITKLRNGETVSVRTGVLRGAGPQGPVGAIGPRGNQGPAGVAGPAGSISDTTSHLNSSSSVSTSSAGYVDVPLDNQVEISLLNNVTTYTFKVTNTGNYLVVIRSDFTYTSGTANGARAIKLVDGSGASVVEAEVQAVGNGTTIMRATAMVTFDPSQTYKLQAFSNDSAGAIATAFRSLKIIRLGSGPPGIQGPTGPAGVVGPAGPTGATGSAASGFVSFNLINNSTADSTLDPTTDGTVVAPNKAYTATADQQVPLPLGTTTAHTPFFLRAMAQLLERRIISQFASAADLATRRATRNQGEIYTQLDTGVFMVKEKNGSETNLARVIFSASAPPSGTGQAAPGVLWVQTS